MLDHYTSYQMPIAKMWQMTRAEIPFSFSHVKDEGNIRHVDRAMLRPMARTKDDLNGSYKLQYTDVDNDQHRSCYICSLLSLNGKQIRLSDGRT